MLTAVNTLIVWPVKYSSNVETTFCKHPTRLLKDLRYTHARDVIAPTESCFMFRKKRKKSDTDPKTICLVTLNTHIILLGLSSCLLFNFLLLH